MHDVIGFAHRGAPLRREDQNSLAAFERALALGATGLESDIALTRDGVPVLVHAGIALTTNRHIRGRRRSELNPAIPSLAELYATCGGGFDLALDMVEPRALDAVFRIANEYGAESRLWITYWHLEQLRSWRVRFPNLKLVYPTLPLRPFAITKLLSRLEYAHVNAVNVYYFACTKRLVDLAHAHRLRVFAWGVRTPRRAKRLVSHGVDGIFCDDVESMMTAIRCETTR